MFAIAVSLAGGKVVFSEMTSDFDIDLQDIRKRITGKTKIVFLCNPNNPTGRIIKRRNLIDFFKSVSVLTVVDEANIEFGGESVVGEVDKRGNIIVLRTFSKGFGLAGIRVGFCAAARDIISEMKRSSQPFLLSSISQKAALAAFSDRQFIKRTKIFMDKERNFLIKGLLRVGLRNVPSEANNLIVKLPVPSSLFCAKLEKRGISVVDGKFFTFPQGSFIRVSPRLRKTNRIFLKAAYEIMKEINKP